MSKRGISLIDMQLYFSFVGEALAFQLDSSGKAQLHCPGIEEMLMTERLYRPVPYMVRVLHAGKSRYRIKA